MRAANSNWSLNTVRDFIQTSFGKIRKVVSFKFWRTLYHDVGYLKNPILKICDFSANMYHMKINFRFLESLLLGLSLKCFFIIFGHFFEILCHFEFDVYFWAADSLPISQKWKYGENHPKYHLMNVFPF